jgi:hypothetical protein
MGRLSVSLLVGALAVATAAGGCGVSDSPDSHAGPGQTGPGGAELGLATVAVEARIGDDRVQSAGTVIDPDRGLVLTSTHTLWGARSLRLRTGLGVLLGRIVARAPCEDVALVETQPRLPGLAALAPARGAAPPAGDTLTVAVRRAGARGESTVELLRVPARPEAAGGPVRIDAGLPPLHEAVRLGELGPEASGAPVLDERGRFVAMAVAGAHAGGAAVPAATVTRLLSELRPGTHRRYRGWGRYYRCAPAMHRYASATHPGYRPRDARLDQPIPATRLPGTEELDG